MITTAQLRGSTGSTLALASPVFGFGRESPTPFPGGFLLTADDPNPNVAKVKVGIAGMRLPQVKHAIDDPSLMGPGGLRSAGVGRLPLWRAGCASRH